MKIPASFFQDKETKRLLEMAAATTALPMCLHGGTDIKISGWGGCEACKWINLYEAGETACQKARKKASQPARSQGVPITFVCHLGFTCVIITPVENNDYTLVLGPFIPSETPQGIEYAVRKGINALKISLPDSQPLPFSLEDIRVIPQGSVSAAASWLLYGLRNRIASWLEETKEEPPVPLAPPDEERHTTTHNDMRVSDDVELKIAGVSLLCGCSGEVRAFLTDILDESKGSQSRMHTQMVRSLSEILDTIQHLGGNTHSAWELYTKFVEEVFSLNTRKKLLNEIDKILRRISKDNADFFTEKYTYMPLVMKYLYQDYASEKLLSRTAEETGVASSSITRMLEKMTGASFSEVLGRIRVRQACRSIRETKMSVTGISTLVGIHDQSNFCKLFRRYRGCSPSTYRNDTRS